MFGETAGFQGWGSKLFVHGMASAAILCYEPILKYLSDYSVILAEADGHSEQTDELVSLENPEGKSNVKSMCQGAFRDGFLHVVPNVWKKSGNPCIILGMYLPT